MLRKKKKEEKISKKFKIMILVTGLLFFIGSGYAIMNTRLSIGGTVEAVPACTIDIVPTLSQSWTNNGETTYMYDLTFTNYDDETLYYWNLRFEVPEDATVTTNAATITTYLTTINLSQKDWNAVVAPGSSVSMQLVIVTSDATFQIGEVLIDHCTKFTDFPVNPDNPDNPNDPNNPDDPTETECNIDLSSTLKGSWMSGTDKVYKYEIVMVNNRTTDIYYWNIKSLVPSDATAVAYVAIPTISNRVLNLQNQTYNGNVVAGGSVSFEIQITTADLNYTMDQLVIDRCNGVITVPEEPDPETPDPETPDPDDPITPVTSNISVTPVVSNSYGNYTYQFNVTIENISDSAINSWHFEYEIPSNASVDQAWSCNYVSSGGVATFGSYSWNGTLQPGASTSVGIVITSSLANYVPVFTNFSTS